MEEMQEGLLRAYANGPLLAQNIMRTIYYSFTMEATASNMWGRAIIAKFIRIGRMLLPNPYTL